VVAGYDVGLIAASCLIGMMGAYAALTVLPASGAPRRQTVIRLAVATLLLTTTVCGVFLLTLNVEFPHLGSELPWSATLESLAFAMAGAAGAILTVALGSPTARNAALAGSFLSSAISCTVFVSMSGLAAPSLLAYDLSRVLLAMAGGSTLCAGGLWLFTRTDGGIVGIASPALVAASLVLVSVMSLSAILPFSDWAVVSATPGSIAFHPVTIVFGSELAVTLVSDLLGAGVDRQAATLAERENERLRQLTESTFEALLIHRDGVVLDANARLCELVGLPLSALKGHAVATFVPGTENATLISPTTGKPQALEIEIKVEGALPLPMEILSRDIPYAGGIARVTALRDISGRRAAEEQIRFLAQHDPLTGLLNRAQFGDIIARRLALTKRDDMPVAVYCIDLDRFKNINDTLGHQAGDMLLKQVAERLLHTIRASDTLARIGGDEFILLQPCASQPESAAQLAKRLIDAISEPFDLDGNQACIGASIGIALGPHDGGQPDELIRNADIALYRAKTSGRGGFCFFKFGMDTLLRQRRDLEQRIGQAIVNGGFELAFQPFFSAAGVDSIRGFEALVRWHTG
jgi:diguanylate cyclase (GGDEF)-like protein/PAS domain S-box-containing protein